MDTTTEKKYYLDTYYRVGDNAGRVGRCTGDTVLVRQKRFAHFITQLGRAHRYDIIAAGFTKDQLVNHDRSIIQNTVASIDFDYKLGD